MEFQPISKKTDQINSDAESFLSTYNPSGTIPVPIEESARINKTEFFLNLEDFASALQMPHPWTATDKRRQVIKTLKKLSRQYKLITVTFTHGKDAWIKHTQIPGDTFTVESKIFNPDFLAKTSPTAKTVLLIGTLLKDEGHVRKDFSEKELHQRFFTTSKQFRRGMKELRSMSGK